MTCLHELNGWVLNTEFLIIMSDAQVGIAEVSTVTVVGLPILLISVQ